MKYAVLKSFVTSCSFSDHDSFSPLTKEKNLAKNRNQTAYILAEKTTCKANVSGANVCLSLNISANEKYSIQILN